MQQRTESAGSPPAWHFAVLQQPLAELIGQRRLEGWLIDATAGLGGHSRLFLEHCPNLKVLAIDVDATMLALAKEKLAPWQGRVTFWQGWFDDFFADSANRRLIDGEIVAIFFDFGISQVHYRQCGRGFSWQNDEELDMRLDPTQQQSAARLISQADASTLENIFRNYGEERFARSISAKIVRRRQQQPLTSCKELAELIKSALPPRQRYGGRIHPATRCFQALRIAVNQELDRIDRVLPAAFDWLAVAGILACISFHSLEDRRVKQFFRSLAVQRQARLINRRVIVATEEEKAINPASRSAKLRLIAKEDANAVASTGNSAAAVDPDS